MTATTLEKRDAPTDVPAASPQVATAARETPPNELDAAKKQTGERLDQAAEADAKNRAVLEDIKNRITANPRLKDAERTRLANAIDAVLAGAAGEIPNAFHKLTQAIAKIDPQAGRDAQKITGDLAQAYSKRITEQQTEARDKEALDLAKRQIDTAFARNGSLLRNEHGYGRADAQRFADAKAPESLQTMSGDELKKYAHQLTVTQSLYTHVLNEPLGAGRGGKAAGDARRAAFEALQAQYGKVLKWEALPDTEFAKIEERQQKIAASEATQEMVEEVLTRMVPGGNIARDGLTLDALAADGINVLSIAAIIASWGLATGAVIGGRVALAGNALRAAKVAVAADGIVTATGAAEAGVRVVEAAKSGQPVSAMDVATLIMGATGGIAAANAMSHLPHGPNAPHAPGEAPHGTKPVGEEPHARQEGGGEKAEAGQGTEEWGGEATAKPAEGIVSTERTEAAKAAMEKHPEIMERAKEALPGRDLSDPKNAELVIAIAKAHEHGGGQLWRRAEVEAMDIAEIEQNFSRRYPDLHGEELKNRVLAAPDAKWQEYIGNYTDAELAEKMRIVQKEGWVTPKESKDLVQKGVLGNMAAGPGKGPVALDKVTFGMDRLDTAQRRIEIMRDQLFRQIEEAPFGADMQIKRVKQWTGEILAKVPEGQRAEVFGRIRGDFDALTAQWDRDIARMSAGPGRDSSERVVTQMRTVFDDIAKETEGKFPGSTRAPAAHEAPAPQAASAKPETQPETSVGPRESAPSAYGEAVAKDLLGSKEIGKYVNEFRELSFKTPDERIIKTAFERKENILKEVDKMTDPRQQRLAKEFFNAHFERAVREIVEPNLRDPLSRWGSGGRERAQNLVDMATRNGVKVNFDLDARLPPGTTTEAMTGLSDSIKNGERVVDAKGALEGARRALDSTTKRMDDAGRAIAAPKPVGFHLDTAIASLERAKLTLQDAADGLRASADAVTNTTNELSVEAKKALMERALPDIEKRIKQMDDLIAKAQAKRPKEEAPKPVETAQGKPAEAPKPTEAKPATAEASKFPTNEYGLTNGQANKMRDVAAGIERRGSIEGADLPLMKSRGAVVEALRAHTDLGTTERGREVIEKIATMDAAQGYDIPKEFQAQVAEALKKIATPPAAMAKAA